MFRACEREALPGTAGYSTRGKQGHRRSLVLYHHRYFLCRDRDIHACAYPDSLLCARDTLGGPPEGRAREAWQLVLVVGVGAWCDSARGMDHLDLGGLQTVQVAELDDDKRVDV